ncbi:hypothetical protein [Actinomadura parmotrematis]|uniref:Uncharacterized protein n=1 Tax=Actinomadura parmotrematis TaxID=2864039 RepID=A0ABS7FVW7_9ACTN|nr:hypothetical protein [Actinomadura parmotrematis]MBW8484421.1 hypothetical protein [Actinomadura parmotrematis]
MDAVGSEMTADDADGALVACVAWGVGFGEGFGVADGDGVGFTAARVTFAVDFTPAAPVAWALELSVNARAFGPLGAVNVTGTVTPPVPTSPRLQRAVPVSVQRAPMDTERESTVRVSVALRACPPVAATQTSACTARVPFAEATEPFTVVCRTRTGALAGTAEAEGEVVAVAAGDPSSAQEGPVEMITISGLRKARTYRYRPLFGGRRRTAVMGMEFLACGGGAPAGGRRADGRRRAEKKGEIPFPRRESGRLPHDHGYLQVWSGPMAQVAT